MIFILFVLALVVCFYGYVFVNFHKELAGIRRRKLLGAVTIPLQIQNCRDDEPEQSSIPAVEVARGDTEPNRGAHRPDVQPVIALRHRSPQEFYQVESPYLGPLFLMPRRKENVNRRAKGAHDRLVSAMNGTAPAAANQKSFAESSTVDSGNGNVIQITARVSAQG